MSLAPFHPTLRAWFAETLGPPTGAQRRGWPEIRGGKHTLIAAPTGSGKTLAAFFSAIDALVREGSENGALPDETRVLYVSPLKALGNDVQKNLLGPLRELRARDDSIPEVRVFVRSGDTTSSQRESMRRRPPHIVVTTPESLYILLTSDGGRNMLRTVRTVIVDEIHAVLGSKRGSHLALSLERLDALVSSDGRALQRIGLSATQKPIESVADFLVGARRECALVDEGHLRRLDLEVELPPSPLDAVCSHETWSEIYARVAALIREHHSTLVFVGTRKMSERVAAELTKLFGADAIACHHSSLSKERRLDAEQRLKAGELGALVATASLELGIDIGDIDLVIQIGSTRSIATLLQRVGRAGHGVGRLPKGRLFPLTEDELVEAAALLGSIGRGVLDKTPQPAAPLDILAQQIVAACVPETWSEDELFASLRRAWPYRELPRADFDAVVALHVTSESGGRSALLHRDGVGGKLRATRRARMTAITSGGAIPDSTQYRVVLEPEGTFVGTLDEDFAIEASGGDIVQLGNASWRILKVDPGVVRVADAKGAPPSLPFWVGEAPARTRELSAEIGNVRELGASESGCDELMRATGFSRDAADALVPYLAEGARALGAVPSTTCIVLERFFDESGGMQLVVHAPFGGRINRAYGLALRKRFCRSFGFELQAAANEEAIVISLGPQHSFPLDDVFDYLRPDSVQDVLEQAVLPTPMFTARWRWNVTRSLVVQRMRGGKRTPAPILRMRADDELVKAFPDVVACGETLPPGDLEIPKSHPLVRQTLEDCLHEAMDIDGLVELLHGLKDGSIRRVAIDTPEPSPFARSILSARPYSFLDDAPLEERRTQAVLSRRVIDDRTADTIGRLDPAAVRLVREQAWPDPRDSEELHEALTWMGFVAEREARANEGWSEWLEDLRNAERVVCTDRRWYAAEVCGPPRDDVAILRGRLEALGPIVPGGHGGEHTDDSALFELERQGKVLRIQLDGKEAWCDRRLLARIQRLTLETLRREIEPVSTADFLRFLGVWQHVDEEARLDGTHGTLDVIKKLAGFEAPAAMWEPSLLAPRIAGYRPEWLDQLAFTGRFAWGRFFGSSKATLRATPITFVPREDLDPWLALTAPVALGELSWQAQRIHDELETRGALFTDDLLRSGSILSSDVERGLEELISLGLLTADSFVSVRQLLRPASRRRAPVASGGRWSLLRRPREGDASDDVPSEETAEFVARRLLARYGVVFRAILERERQPIAWRHLARACRLLELRGDIRGGRFVAGYAGEQFALPEAVTLMRRLRRDKSEQTPVTVAPCDPLNLEGILTPGAKVPSRSSTRVEL